MQNQPSVYVIDPKRFKRDWFMVIFLVIFFIIWFPATLFMTGMFLFEEKHPFVAVWLIFGWAGSLLIPYSLMTRNRKHILTAAGDRLIISGTRFFAGQTVEIHQSEMDSFTLEHYDSGDRESVPTLNFLQKSGFLKQRVMLATYVNAEGKKILFNEIKAFLESNGFRLKYKNALEEDHVQ